jgi:fibronectin type 3 domain-containing protein
MRQVVLFALVLSACAVRAPGPAKKVEEPVPTGWRPVAHWSEPTQEMLLNWDQPAGEVAGYTVYRKKPGMSQSVELEKTSDRRATDSSVVRGTTYRYYVVAVDAMGKTLASSDECDVTVPSK